jgi:RNA polymerase sigma-70 factor, ECF subfamily
VPVPADDVELAALQANEVGAVKRFVEQSLPHVERLVLNFIGPRHEVPDLAHDAMLAALTSVHRYQGEFSGLRPWLIGVTTNVVRAHLRRQRVRRVLVPWDDQAAGWARDDGANPEQQAMAREVWDVLARFPTDERLALSLRYFADCTLPELASAMNVSLATGKRVLKRARERFEQQRLDGGGPSLPGARDE